MQDWTVQQSADLYRLNSWGSPYFGVNALGHLTLKPTNAYTPCDLFEIIQSLVQRGIEPPILLRFNDIIRDRVHLLQAAFDEAILEFNYPEKYQIAFPIKVNPQSHVVEVIQQVGHSYELGIEVGSKPELLALFASNQAPNSLLLCNGYKDAEYIELALLTKKLGKQAIIIVEQLYELPLILEVAKRLDIQAEIGLRTKLSAKGAGRWQSSSGDHAKFGLNSADIMLCLELLKKEQKEEWVKLLHFHMGSQITSIEAIKKALNEASKLYVELKQFCPFLHFFDVGGGLGVDYEGNQTSSESSMNYTIQEYARDVVFAISDACEQAKIPCPTIVTESGRALTAHHAVLITEVVDVAVSIDPNSHLEAPPTSHPILMELYELHQLLNLNSCRETFHDAQALKEKIIESFLFGHLRLLERAYAEKAYHLLLAKISQFSLQLSEMPNDLKHLKSEIYDNYFCNFSVFQSLPDFWAIHHLFPIIPMHRLQEQPTRRAIIVDMTCDSDGKIDRFVGAHQQQNHLMLHSMNQSPYYLGIFLVGAYQEILGGLHNLFGDANAVHIDIQLDGSWAVQHIVEGDTMAEVLNYVQYQAPDLKNQLNGLIEKGLQEGTLTNQESAHLKKKFREALESYTYLTV